MKTRATVLAAVLVAVPAAAQSIKVEALYWPEYPGYENATFSTRAEVEVKPGVVLRARATFCMWPSFAAAVATAIESWAAAGGATCRCGAERCYVVAPVQRNAPPPQDWYGLGIFGAYCKADDPSHLWISISGGFKSGKDGGDNALQVNDVDVAVNVAEARQMGSALGAWAASPTYKVLIIEKP